MQIKGKRIKQSNDSVTLTYGPYEQNFVSDAGVTDAIEHADDYLDYSSEDVEVEVIFIMIMSTAY